MKAIVNALVVAGMFAFAGAASAQIVSGTVDTNNEKAKVKQSQKGLLNSQKASVGSVNSGIVSGTFKANNKGAEVNQDQAGLLNSQSASIGSMGKP